MVQHIWGDGFDFETLQKAQMYIEDLAQGISLVPIMKEKYGTLRYEWLCLWNREKDGSLTDLGIVTSGSQGEYPTPEQMTQFYRIVDAATRQFPTVAAEIVDDALWGLDIYENKTKSTNEIIKRWERIVNDENRRAEEAGEREPPV